VRAAILEDPAQPLVLGERAEPEPDGMALIEMSAAALNPVDLGIASGRFFAGRPPLPYVPGIEAVGTVVSSGRFSPGTRVFACGSGLGVTRDGTLAERLTAADEVLIEVPDSADDATAVALGTAGLAAWMPLAWRCPVRDDESVLILGATGSVGLLAVQIAKLLGAGRVLAVGRNPDKLEEARMLGADEAVPLGDGFPIRLAEAAAVEPPTLVLDMLWGEPLEAAIPEVGLGARIVNVGQAGVADREDGPSAAISSAILRARRVELIGWSNYAAPIESLAEEYSTLLGHAADGRIAMEHEVGALADAPDAWRRLSAGRAPKLVVVP